MDGEPWEHTARICATVHEAALMIAVACGAHPDVLTKLTKPDSHYMPDKVTGRKRKKEPEPENIEEVKKQSSDDWMRGMANRGQCR